jgi:hypothetical protein
MWVNGLGRRRPRYEVGELVEEDGLARDLVCQGVEARLETRWHRLGLSF